MSTRAQLPHKIEKRRKDALERRISDTEKYASQELDTPGFEWNKEIQNKKLDIALQDMRNLRKKLGLLKDTTE